MNDEFNKKPLIPENETPVEEPKQLEAELRPKD